MPNLQAPRPHFEAYTSRGRVYLADSEGVISNADFLDVGDLIASGCCLAGSVSAPATSQRVAAPSPSPTSSPKSSGAPLQVSTSVPASTAVGATTPKNTSSKPPEASTVTAGAVAGSGR